MRPEIRKRTGDCQPMGNQGGLSLPRTVLVSCLSVLAIHFSFRIIEVFIVVSRWP